MKNTAQVKLEINIDGNIEIVKITGKTFIDGKEVCNYDKEIGNKSCDRVYLDEVLNMLNNPLKLDERFKVTTGIK